MFLGAVIAMLLLPSVMKAQTGQINQTTQTIRGQVCDVASGEPMIGVTITIENGTTMATVSDVDGNFVINNVPVGRHSVRATYIGYEPVLLKEQLVSSGKELVLTLRMSVQCRRGYTLCRWYGRPSPYGLDVCRCRYRRCHQWHFDSR